MDISQMQSLLLPLFKNITLLPFLVVCYLLFFLSLYSLIHIEKFRFKQNELKKRQQTLILLSKNTQTISDDNIHEMQTINQQIKPAKFVWLIRYILYLTICFSGILAFTGTNLLHTAYTHGYREYTKYNIEEIIHSVKHTPKEDILPENLENITVIYYRFGCNDCNQLYTELNNHFDTLDNVYWIATRSEQGQKLRESFPVEHVPSAIFITNEKTAVPFELYTKYTTNGSTIISPNTDSIRDLLNFRMQHIKQ